MTSSMLAEMTTNPGLGIIIFTLGGLAGAIFYLPFKKVKNWAWESYWLVYALFGLVIVPWVLALTTCPNVMDVLRASPSRVIWYCYLCGFLWGLGGLTWGLMIRYLGVGLGLAIGCGLCSAAGTLIPPIIAGNLQSLYGTPSANMSLVSVAVSILGIIFVGMAGMSKENELPEEEKKKAVAEFDFKKGITVAIFSGLMSSAMSFGLQGGAKIEELALITTPVAPIAWKGMPVLVVVLLGGFTVNFLWCLFLNFKNKTTGDYTKSNTPVVGNVVFAGIAGAIWCSQFICFKTGEPKMGDMGYVGWAVLMASAILFSSLLGILLGEWKGTSSKTRGLLTVGLVLLVVSSVVAGYSGKLKTKAPAPSEVIQAIEKTPVVQ
jgi:L-rhamnose-H+ transport protein